MNLFDFTQTDEQQLTSQPTFVTDHIQSSIMPTMLTYVQRVANNVWKAYKYCRDCILYDVHPAYGYFGYLLMNKITPRHVRTFRKSLETTKMSPLTVNCHIAAIAVLFRCAMEMEDIDDMPAMPKFAPEQTERVRVFTPDEQKAVVSHFRETGNSWMADMFIVGCRPGMCKGEIVAVGDQGPRAAVIAPNKQSVHLPDALTKTKTGCKVDLNAQASAASVRLQGCIA